MNLKKTDDDRKFDISRLKVKKRARRVFASSADEGPIAPPGATQQLLFRYFDGADPEEKSRTEKSLLVTLVVIFMALYVAFPSFMHYIELQKKPDEVYIPAGGYEAMPRSAKTKREEKPHQIKKETIPQLYPEIRDVNLSVEDDTVEITESDWNSLSINGSVDGYDFGLGGSGGGPTINAGAGGEVPEPELLYRVEPEYPEAARRARVDGFVLIQAIVSKTGDVIDIKVLQSPPEKYGFAEKAKEAVAKWKFKPSIYRGKPVNVRIRFAVEFNLLY